MNPAQTTRPDFDAAYRADEDPFDIGGSWYERRKMDVLLACLGHERYRRGWDTACGTGHLTSSLAERCDALVASDASPRAVELTAARLSTEPGEGPGEVSTLVHALPDPLGDQQFDLIVLSEVVYYLPTSELLTLPQTLADSASAEGCEIMMVNWSHHPHDAPRSGRQAAGLLDAALTQDGWVPAVRHDEDEFVLRSWVRGA